MIPALFVGADQEKNNEPRLGVTTEKLRGVVGEEVSATEEVEDAVLGAIVIVAAEVEFVVFEDDEDCGAEDDCVGDDTADDY
ncbi:MAG: hypothetical protein AAB371_01305 [Patescibacteria group bacterium]